jgi:hypothetical protein
MRLKLRENIGLLGDILEIAPYISLVLAPIISLIATATGIALTFLNVLKWGVAFIGFGIIGLTVYLIAKNKKSQMSMLRNRHLVIEKDELDIHVKDDGRFIERRVTLRALRQVDSYRFKYYWTGSSDENNIECRESDGYIAQTYPLLWNRLQWQPLELCFHEPMKAGEIRTITLRYTMLDPDQMALPYHMISHAHVRNCKQLVARLYFVENIKPDEVYLSHRDENNIAVLTRVLALDEKLQAYVINEKPRANIKYSIEWAWKGRKLIQHEQRVHLKDYGTSTNP